MNTPVERHISFPDLLTEITPRTQDGSEKYSFNFAQYVRHEASQKRIFWMKVLYAPTEEHPTWDPQVTNTQRIYIGDPGEGWITGSWMPRVITMGGKAERWAFPPEKFPMGFVDITQEFLALYLQRGKCAIDPEHVVYTGDSRYTRSGDTRTCRFCGRREYLHTSTRTVEDATWKTTPQEQE